MSEISGRKADVRAPLSIERRPGRDFRRAISNPGRRRSAKRVVDRAAY